MTMPSEPAAPAPVEASIALGAGRERRLHPLSWLFVLLASLREFALPLIALLFFGRGGGNGWGWESAGLVGTGVLTLIAVVRYYTYRFRIEAGELVIRSGVLHKNIRHIPLHRIQNVALKRNVLHRVFGVAEVRLESAVGGVSAEAQMRVLSMRDAHALEVLVRAQGAAAVDSVDAQGEPDRGEVLLSLSTVELIKLGLTSNRGLLLGAAGFGFFSQFGGNGFDDVLGELVGMLFGYARELHLGWIQWAVAGSLLFALIAAAMRLVSVLLMLLQFHGFTLRELDQRLSVESGLLTRVRSNAPLRKIQHWTVRESLLHRWFARRSLNVETAVMQAMNESQGLSALVPIAPPPQIDALLARWLPWLNLAELPWQPLHPGAWRRLAFFPLVLTLLIAGALTLRFGAPALTVLLLAPWWIFRARRIAEHSRWAVTDRVLAWRSGWLDRHLSFAEIGKLQGLQLLQSPFDRRRGMASVVADTAGASPFGHRLELRYLPEAQARELYERLGAQVASSEMRW
jgi:putative membrane protein